MSAGGISVFVHALAFGRQVMLAGFFGVARALDGYVLLYAIATFVVFTIATIFDTVAVPWLVRMRERHDDAAVIGFARRVLRIGFLLGASTSMLFLMATPLLAPVIATGFSPQERAELTALMWFFLPWTFISAPYYAFAAWLKANWRFGRVLLAEMAIVAISIAVLALWHDGVGSIPLAFGAGYLGGILFLMSGALIFGRAASYSDPAVRSLLRNVGELYLANQSGGLGTLIDRHIQSFIPGGGISAVNYAAQLVNGLATVLLFREIFVVPLVREEGRSERLGRLIAGLVLVSVPVAGFIGCFAYDIVSILFERGRFDKAATEMTASVLQISVILIVIGVVLTPLARIFQIADRIHLTHVMYWSSALSLGIFGYLFVILLDLGLPGVAWMQVAASVVCVIVTAYLVHLCGERVGWRRVAKYFLIALAASTLAYAAACAVSASLQHSWLRLVAGGASYGTVVTVIYLLARSQLSVVMFGVPQRDQ